MLDVSRMPLLFGACIYGWPTPPALTQTWAQLQHDHPDWANVKAHYPEWIYVRNEPPPGS